MEDECFICIEDNTDEPVMSILDYEIERTCDCRGMLHAKCYSRWLRENPSCPICRKPVNIPFSPPRDTHVITLQNFEIDNLPNNYGFYLVRERRNGMPNMHCIVLVVAILLFFCLFLTLFLLFF